MKDKVFNKPKGYRYPEYDERSSCFIHRGQDYGVGHKQSVGKDKASGYAVPVGRIKTLRVDEV